MKAYAAKSKAGQRAKAAGQRTPVQAKKNLGQHFLRNTAVAERIARTIADVDYPRNVLEIGPGMGVLTQFLWQLPNRRIQMVELDRESVAYLQATFPDKTTDGQLLSADFLRLDLTPLFQGESFCLIGNYPYNISSQILFKAVETRDRIPVISGMFQKEVAERVAAGPGSKVYGILSVWIQAFYDAEYLFTVEPCEFNPPPQVRSGVIRLVRKADYHLPCDEKLFLKVVKAAFGQRRKTLRNALRSLEMQSDSLSGLSAGSTGTLAVAAPPAGTPVHAMPARVLERIPAHYLALRAEQLSVADFVALTQALG